MKVSHYVYFHDYIKKQKYTLRFNYLTCILYFGADYEDRTRNNLFGRQVLLVFISIA